MVLAKSCTDAAIGFRRNATQPASIASCCVSWLSKARLRKAISDLTLDKLILQEAARGNY